LPSDGVWAADHSTSDSAVEIDNESDNSSGSSLFKTQCVPYSPKQGQRNPIRKFVHSSGDVEARDSSSDSSFEPRPLTLKAIFERLKKKKKERKKRKKRKYKPKGRLRGRPKGRKTTRCSQINKKQKQVKDKGSGFPFLESENVKKPLPWRKILTFEQAVESLKQMNVGEDLEGEDFDSRRYKYLDDDGSLSPIEESETVEEAVTTLT
uniref:TATA box-binding protein-associated factor RNA polymerase I subunit D n=1 Tax=Canis lupus dingo TaxID=286419 RepID=A0A8C0R5N0_CANLU